MKQTPIITAGLPAIAALVLAGCQPATTAGTVGEFSLEGADLVAVETGVPADPAEQSLAPGCTGNAALAAAMSDAVNAARGIEGKVILSGSEVLTQVAQSHACDVARMGQATVAGSNGSNVVDRARAVNYPTCGVVQLVSAGVDPTAIVNGWLASKPHRVQVLGQLSDEIGVGTAPGPGGRIWYSVVIGDNCR